MRKVLIIEDETNIRENIVEFLEDEGFNVAAAHNGLMGVETAIQFLPDIIVSDVMMPELDGYGVLQRLRENPATLGIPFIFLTAKADKPDVRIGMELGADDYLTKPFLLKDLLKTINSRLAKQETFTATIRQRDDKPWQTISALILESLSAIERAGTHLRDERNSLSPIEINEHIATILFASAEIRATLTEGDNQ